VEHLLPSNTQQAGNGSAVPHYDHVVVVVEENHTASQILRNAPYISSLAANGAVLTNYKALTHPSQPNYLGLYAGNTFGVTDDGNHSFSAPTLADSLSVCPGGHGVFRIGCTASDHSVAARA